MDPYNYPSGAPDVVAQFGAGLQDMGQRLESTLQAEDELGRFAELIPRWLAANPAQNIGALLQMREPEVEQLRGMAEGAIEDPVGVAQSLSQAGIEAVQDPLGTAEQMSALEMLGGGKALSSIAKRLGRRDVGVTDEPMPDVQPTRKGQLSQQLYEQSVARGEVPGEAAQRQLRQSIEDKEADLFADQQVGWDVHDKWAELQQIKNIQRQFIDNLPDVEKARLDRAVKQGFNIDAFHGTAGDITDFDPGLLGKTTDAPSARKAFFFSADSETANSYAQYADAVELGRTTPHELGAMLRPHVDKLQQVDQQLASQRQKIIDSFGGYGPSHIPAFDYDAHAKHDAIINRAIDNDPEVKALTKEIDNLRLKINTQYQSVMPVKLRMTNPLVHDFKGESYREVSYHDLLQTAKDKGHDGVIMKNTTDGGPVTDIYAVFEPQQIRSQYATFDPERAPREGKSRPYTSEEVSGKQILLQEDIEVHQDILDSFLNSKAVQAARQTGLLFDQNGNLSTKPAPESVEKVRRKIRKTQNQIDTLNNKLADLIKGKLRTPSRTAGPTYVLAEAAFPLGGITAAIAYDVNQRGDR
tara:strand:- start:1127 stop:2875 length:1749 start_codon:yes stop_codon:yes gene_type:complete